MLAVSIQVVWAMMRPQGGPQVPMRRYWILSHAIAGKVLPVLAWLTALSGLWYLRASGFALFLLFIYLILIIVFVAYAEWKKRSAIPEAMTSTSGVDAATVAAAVAVGAVSGETIQPLEESSQGSADPIHDESEVELDQVTL
jgi:hypothetical protein